MSWSDSAAANNCTGTYEVQSLNPDGKPLSFSDAIPYRDLLRMAEYEEKAAEIALNRDARSKRIAEQYVQRSREIQQHYRDEVARYGLVYCAQRAAADDGQYGGGRFF